MHVTLLADFILLMDCGYSSVFWRCGGQKGMVNLQSFGQYVATRRIREQAAIGSAGSNSSISRVRGGIATHAGMHLITGMPVFIYTTEGPLPAPPKLPSEVIPPPLARGERDGLSYAVVASAPGFAPLKPVLPLSRLQWLLRESANALSEAHEAGVLHGRLGPEHFYAQGNRLLIEGFGLPWLDEPSPTRPPEGFGAKAADVFALAKAIQFFASGDAEKKLEGELGALLDHCTHSRPADRPSSQQLAMATQELFGFVAPVSSKMTLTEIRANKDAAETLLNKDTASNAVGLNIPIVDQGKEVPKMQTPVIKEIISEKNKEQKNLSNAAEDLTAKELRTKNLSQPDVAKSQVVQSPANHPVQIPVQNSAKELATQLASSNPSSNQEVPDAVRIGWEEDDSWRTVKKPSAKTSRVSWLWLAVPLLALAILGIALRKPNNKPVVALTRSMVNFHIDSAQNLAGRLYILEAPTDANLRTGAMLGAVPGPVVFPASGHYKVQVAIDGYERSEATLDFPADNGKDVSISVSK